MRKLLPQEITRPSAAQVRRMARHPLAVVLDDIRSAYNVGAIFRTADALLVAQVICCGHTPTPEHHSVAKTALGAEQTVPWTHHGDPVAAVEQLRQSGHRIAALEQTDAPTLLDAIGRQDFPLVLVLGNEVTGVQQRVLDACDVAIELPQFGAKASLNVAVAFGVAGYGLIAGLLR